MNLSRSLALTLCATALLFALPPQRTEAAFPGANGLVATSFQGDIWTVEPDGSNGRNITNDGSSAYPAFSPDGTKIAFLDWNAGLSLMDPDGSNRTVLVDISAFGFGSWVDWAPDGSYITLLINREIYTVNPDGTGLAKLLSERIFAASLSPDGTQYTVQTGDGIGLLDADGTNLNLLLPDSGSDWSGSPDWAPDGSRIVFNRNVSGVRDIWTIRPDGTGLTNLTNSPEFERDAKWSPDGTKVVFGRSTSVLHTINPDGTGLAPLFDPPGAGNPIWNDWQPVVSVCGNGVVEGAEACDGGACCEADCTLSLAGTVCRASIDPECDPAETCDGAAVTCPEDTLLPDGNVCDDGVVETVGESCTAGLCGCLGPDLDVDLIPDVCDPSDATIEEAHKVVLKPKRSKLGAIRATRGAIISPGFDPSEGFSFAFSDGLDLMVAASASPGDCRTTPRGKVICRSANKTVRARFTPEPQEPGRYRYNIKLKGLDFTFPLAAPVTMVITEEATSIDHTIVLSTCDLGRSTMSCR